MAAEVIVLRDPAQCHTPACKGPAAIYQIGKRVLLVCQRCGGHWGASLEHEDRFPGAGYPVDHPAYGTE